MNRTHSIKGKHYEIEPIADGVFAAIAIPGSGSVGNAGIIDLGNKTVLFDTGNTQQAAAELAQAAIELTQRPVDYVINSHWHGDHIRGNQVFPESLILSTSLTRDIMERVHPERIRSQQEHLPQLQARLLELEQQIAVERHDDTLHALQQQHGFLSEIAHSLPSLSLVLPHVTFDDQLTLHGSKRSATLCTYGGWHTASDLFLLLPDCGIAFLGDLAAINNHPLLRDGDPDGWLRILARLKHLELQRIVVGHGMTARADELAQMEAYIMDLQHLVQRFAAAGHAAEQIEQLEMPAAYREWLVPELFRQNCLFLFQRMTTTD